MNSSQK